MRLTLAKWGNSLAVRIPANIARSLSLSEGTTLECETTNDGKIELIPASARERTRRISAHFTGVNQRLAGKRMTTPTNELLRDSERY